MNIKQAEFIAGCLPWLRTKVENDDEHDRMNAVFVLVAFADLGLVNALELLRELAGQKMN
jgi:hypothetical protein